MAYPRHLELYDVLEAFEEAKVDEGGPGAATLQIFSLWVVD